MAASFSWGSAGASGAGMVRPQRLPRLQAPGRRGSARGGGRREGREEGTTNSPVTGAPHFIVVVDRVVENCEAISTRKYFEVHACRRRCSCRRRLTINVLICLCLD